MVEEAASAAMVADDQGGSNDQRGTWPFVRVVVVNYNGHPYLYDAVESLLATEWPRDRFEIVVVDNASADGSEDECLARFPSIRLVRLSKNGGFPANNVVMNDLDGVDYVGLINNDAVVEPDWLEPLVAALQADGSLGAASARVLFLPRFFPITLRSATRSVDQTPRDVGVRVSGLRVGGRDVWSESQLTGGFWHREFDPRDQVGFAWTSETGECRVAFDQHQLEVDEVVSMRLSSFAGSSVSIEANGETHELALSASPRWFDVPVCGATVEVVNNAGMLFHPTGHASDRGFGALNGPEFDRAAEVFACCGNGVLLRREYIEDVGGFDDRYLAYYEDVDMAWRGRARGWRYTFVPESVVRHHRARTSVEGSSFKVHHSERNHLLTLVKNAPASMISRGLARHVGRTVEHFHVDMVEPFVHGRTPNNTRPLRRVRVSADFLRVLPTAASARRHNRRAQTVPDEALLEWVSPTEGS